MKGNLISPLVMLSLAGASFATTASLELDSGRPTIQQLINGKGPGIGFPIGTGTTS